MATTLENADAKQGLDLGIGFAIALLTIGLGGFLCARAIDNFGEIGAVALWVLGWSAGTAAKQVMSRPRKLVGYALAIAVIIAFLVAEVAWIKWNIKDVEGWGQAIGLLPMFCQQFQWSALLGAICAFFGASTAYSTAGVRYRIVKVVEE